MTGQTDQAVYTDRYEACAAATVLGHLMAQKEPARGPRLFVAECVYPDCIARLLEDGEGRIGGLAVVAPCPVGVEAAEKLVVERRRR